MKLSACLRFLTRTGYLCLAFGAGCQCSSDIRPNAPPRIPPPLHLRPTGRSTVFIPVEIPIREVEDLVNDAVPDSLYSVRNEQIRGGIFPIKVDLDITRDGRIRTRTDSGFVQNQLPIRASGRIRIPPGIWRPFSSTFSIEAQTRLTLNEDWKTVAETTGDFTWDEPPYITILGIKIGLRGKAENALKGQLVKLAPKIDGLIEDKVNLRKEADKIWDSIGDPIQIRSYPPAWLLIRPVGTYFTQAVSEADTFVVGLNVEAELETVLGERPEHVLGDSLPPLVPLPDSLSRTGMSGFQMHLPVTITYTEARNMLMWSLGDKPLNVQNDVTVRVDSADLYPSGSSIIARIAFRAKLTNTNVGTKGTLYLRGLPTYNPIERTISIDSLDYDLQSKDALTHAADWFFHGTFLDLTRDKFHFPVGNEIELVSKQITEALNNRALGKHIVLNGVIGRISPADLYLSDDGINVDVFVTGTMTARVRGLGEVL